MVALNKLNLHIFEGCLFGSGFEAQPKLLDKIATLMPLIGNVGNVVSRVKSADYFFSELTALGIRHPKVLGQMPNGEITCRYLKKFAGGTGGTHITFAAKSGSATGLLAGEYYQEEVIGKSVSMLFLANENEIFVVGFNEQWLSPSALMPFRYGGAVGNVSLVSEARLQLLNAATRLTRAFGLRGLNSLDAIVQDAVVDVLELNPRLSATVDLYSECDENLIARHIDICLNRHNPPGLEYGFYVRASKAHAVVYAEFDIEISASFKWPAEWLEWITDTYNICGNSISVSCDAPICTVIASGNSADCAKRLVQARVALIQGLLTKLYDKNSLTFN